MAKPNRLLRAARNRTPSVRTPGTSMSRDELAQAVVRWIVTHDKLCRDVSFDGNHLGKIERGIVRRPRQHYVAALCAVLGATEAELGFGSGGADDRADLMSGQRPGPMPNGWHREGVATAVETTTRDDLGTTRRTALAAAALAGVALTQPLQRWLEPLASIGGRAIGRGFSTAEVEALDVLVDQLKAWGGTGQPVLARKAVVAQLGELGERLRHAPSGPLTDRATLIAARLAEAAASMSWDAGAHRTAQQYYLLAVQLAKVGGDDSLAAIALAALGRQCYDLGRPDDGLEVVQLAQYGTRRCATPRLRAMLATREAWAYAQRGEVRAFHRTVGLATEYFAETTADEPCRWIRNFDAAELHGVIGARFRDLARFDSRQAKHAQAHIRQALALRSPARLRNRAFDLIGLARTYLITNEPEQASALVAEALPLTHQWATGRVGVKLADFHRESGRFATVPSVREVRTAIRDRLAA